jgi:hypothetical protein
MNCPKCKSDMIYVSINDAAEHRVTCKCPSCDLQFNYTAELHLCKDCAFYSYSVCEHPLVTTVNIVTGELSYQFASTMRLDWKPCKTEALLFKPKPKSIIHRIIAWITGGKNENI